ncbi:hypothetical protein N8343_08320, partial [Akkermansiaceae bacterium]|nr:hypothetical protein [Akkermansiaceae bacterium]
MGFPEGHPEILFPVQIPDHNIDESYIPIAGNPGNNAFQGCCQTRDGNYLVMFNSDISTSGSEIQVLYKLNPRGEFIQVSKGALLGHQQLNAYFHRGKERFTTSANGSLDGYFSAFKGNLNEQEFIEQSERLGSRQKISKEYFDKVNLNGTFHVTSFTLDKDLQVKNQVHLRVFKDSDLPSDAYSRSEGFNKHCTSAIDSTGKWLVVELDYQKQKVGETDVGD